MFSYQSTHLIGKCECIYVDMWKFEKFSEYSVCKYVNLTLKKDSHRKSKYVKYMKMRITAILIIWNYVKMWKLSVLSVNVYSSNNKFIYVKMWLCEDSV